MFLGVTRNAVGEWCFGQDIHGSAVDELSAVECVDLVLQFQSVGVAVGVGNEPRVMLGFIAAEQQQVGYTQKVQINERILCFQA